MKKLAVTLAIALALTGCYTYTKGEPGKPGQPGKPGKTVAMEKNGFTILKQDNYGGWENRGNIVIKSKSGLAALYKEINIADVPEVDFTKNNVIGLFLGQKSSGGYSIDVVSVKVTGDTAEVTIKEIAPAGMATMAITQPYCIALIPKTDKVKFIGTE